MAKTMTYEKPWQKLIEVRSSGIEGRGAFALKNMKPGDIIGKLQGEKFFDDDWESSTVMNIGEGWNLEPSSPWVCVNHSCEPNVELEEESGDLYFVVSAHIKPGDEVCFDYSWPSDCPWDQVCKCGSKVCRGYIVSAAALKAHKVVVKKRGTK